MKYLFLCLISLNVYSATLVSECGKYDIYGELKKNNKLKVWDLIVNPGSMSEYKFHLTDGQERKLISYSGHSIKVKATILKLAPEYQGVLTNVESVDYAVPDPANMKGVGGFVLIKKEKCK
ncbi:MAG: hypothetical protein H7177_09345 [Rhizobacter sp.]|nr:hypothetical protein [Bacteriovorax sp.]